jgi:hypothetical protein
VLALRDRSFEGARLRYLDRVRSRLAFYSGFYMHVRSWLSSGLIEMIDIAHRNRRSIPEMNLRQGSNRGNKVRVRKGCHFS